MEEKLSPVIESCACTAVGERGKERKKERKKGRKSEKEREGTRHAR